jgi:hypothetical protein
MKAFLVVLRLSVAIFVTGLVMMLLWGWFAVPLGVPAIGFFHSIGLATLVGFLAHQAKPKAQPPKDQPELGESLRNFVLTPKVKAERARERAEGR